MFTAIFAILIIKDKLQAQALVVSLGADLVSIMMTASVIADKF